MKIEKLLLGLFASFLMVGCSQNDDLPNGGEEAKGKNSYVAVKICAPKTLGSRATTDDNFADADGNEALVKNAHFFFFNDQGQPVNVNEGKNYVIKTISTNPDNDDNGSTESMTNAIVVLEKPDVYPTRMAVVLNWDYSGTSLSLNDVSGLAQQSIDETDAISETTGFIMSSSVYYKNGIVNYAEITGANFGATPTDAEQKPVYAYVERLAAKVSASLNDKAPKYDSTLEAFDTGVTYKNAQNNEMPIYAKVLGWQINTTNPSSYLIKMLNKDWGTTDPFTGWNESDKFRSYWGISSTPSKYEKEEFEYESIKEGFNHVEYCLENTTGNATKALFKAVIGFNDNGTFKALDLWQWYGKYYLTPESMLVDVVAMINSEVDKLGANSIDVKEADIDFVYNNERETSYQIHFQLKPTVQDQTIGTKTLSSIVSSIDYAKNWADGRTYYFTSVKHLNNELAVIRNHAYDLQVTDVKGLGTPVNDNTQPKIPEPVDPGTTETYIAAQINVLSWRLINNDVVLGH